MPLPVEAQPAGSGINIRTHLIINFGYEIRLRPAASLSVKKSPRRSLAFAFAAFFSAALPLYYALSSRCKVDYGVGSKVGYR